MIQAMNLGESSHIILNIQKWVKRDKFRFFTMFVILILVLSILTINSVTASELSWAVTSDPSIEIDDVHDVAVDTSGVYIVGRDKSTGDYQWRIEKRNLTDGSLIWHQTSNPSSGDDVANGVAFDSSGVYVVGHDRSPGEPQWRIEKRNHTDGTLISSFGTEGVITINPSTGTDVAIDVDVRGSNIYVLGNDLSPGDSQWRIEKRNNADGTLIWEATSNPSTRDDEVYGIAIHLTEFYIVGYDVTPGNSQWRIEKRRLTDGALISHLANNPSTGSDVPRDVTVDDSGIYIVGCDYSAGNDQWRIEKRSHTDLSLIWQQNSNPSSGDEEAKGVTDTVNGIYIVGSDGSPNPDTGDSQWRIEKRNNTDGTLIPNFGTDGVILENPSVRSDKAEGVGVDKSSIYIVGSDASLGTGNWQWRMEKRYMYTANFSIDIDPPSISITQGDSGTSTIIITSLYGFTQPIDLSYSWEGDTPNNITVNLSTPITPPSDETITSQLEILSGNTASLGNFNLNIASKSGDLTYTLLVPVKITQSITPPGGCIIVTATYGSPLAPEVAFMRHVRDDLIGSNNLGRTLVQGWNMFYYSWSPPIAERITSSTLLQNMFRILLLPLISTVHSTALIYTAIATMNPTVASLVAFFFTAVLSLVIYIAAPLLALRILYKKNAH